MSVVEIVIVFLMFQSPFGPVQFTATPHGPDHVVVELMSQEPVVLRFDKELNVEILKGEIETCQPENPKHLET